MTQVPLGDGAHPHDVIVGDDGAAWVTDGGLNAIVRVDSANHGVRSFPLPANRSDANLNTAAFDALGVLWFTGQNGIYGRLDPRTGDMTVYDASRGRGPYGITATPSGEVSTHPLLEATSREWIPPPVRRARSTRQPLGRAPAGCGRTATA